MGRVYTVSFEDVAVAATQDLINLTATANMAFEVLRVEFGQRGLTAWEAKPIRFRRMPATVTAGSGGSAATPQPVNKNDAAATVTARVNDTTAMTTNATAVTLFTRMFEFLNGFIWVPLPDERIVIAPSQGLAINLPTGPSGSTNMSGSLTFRELF